VAIYSKKGMDLQDPYVAWLQAEEEQKAT